MANDQNSPSLYVCTADRKLDSRSYIVRAIRLRDLSDPNANLEQQFYWWGRYLPHGMGCALLGTEIVLGGGVLNEEERLFRREQRQRRLAGQPRQPLHDAVMRQPNMNCFLARNVLGDPDPNPRRYGQFQKPKPNPLLVVVEGNLYALGGFVGALPNISPTFEVFDRQDGIWVSLPDPPLNPSLYYTHFSYATVGSRIMVCGHSARERTPVYSYDVAPVNSLLAQPQHNELTVTGPFPEWVLFLPICFLFQGRGFGLELDDDGVVQRTQKDKHFVIFTLESQPQPGKGKKRGRSGEGGPSGEDGDGSDEDEIDWMIRSYLWQGINFHTNSLKLDLPTGVRHVKYSFAHSRGRNICLVIADFPLRNEVIDDGTSVRASRIMRYHVIQFEYTIAKTDYYDYVTFLLKGSRTFEDWSAGQHFISGDLLGSFVL